MVFPKKVTNQKLDLVCIEEKWIREGENLVCNSSRVGNLLFVRLLSVSTCQFLQGLMVGMESELGWLELLESCCLNHCMFFCSSVEVFKACRGPD